MIAKKFLFLGILTGFLAHDLCALSNLARNDAYPVFSTLDPHSFLYKREKMDMKGLDYGTDNFEFMGLTISPFGQTADAGKDYNSTGSGEGNTVPLGDVTGKWAMVPMTFNDGNYCENGVYPCELACTLSTAYKELFNPAGDNPYQKQYDHFGFNNPGAIDPKEECGFFSNELKYTKRGCRMELAANIRAGFGFSTQASFADIKQTLLNRINKTSTETCESDGYITPDNINKYLMDEINNIAREQGYELSNFHESGVEEVRLNLYWRKAAALNRDRKGYPKCLLIPFFMASGSFSPKTINPHKIYAVPFGNNGHNAYGFSGGLNIDFFESIEVGAEGGLTHFGPRDICGFHVPNSPLQQGLYPFSTTVKYEPGHNWHFAAKVGAEHFLENLSVFFQFIVVHHEKDHICIKDCGQTCCNGEPVKLDHFHPDVIENRSMWQAKMGNLGINYDVSPNVTLGFLWQAPLSQSGTYRSSTVMASFSGTY